MEFSAHIYRLIGKHLGIDPNTIIYCNVKADGLAVGIVDIEAANVALRTVNTRHPEVPQELNHTTVGDPKWDVYEVFIREII